MAIEKNREFSHGDLMHWDDGERYELWNGRPVALAAPSFAHQRIGSRLVTRLNVALEETGCEAHYGVDVRLFQQSGESAEEQRTVLRPDILVLCDAAQDDGCGITGAPRLIIEILSDSTRTRDQIDKFDAYQRAGVPEYWIVDPKSETVSIFTLVDGRYHAPVVYSRNSTIAVPMAPEDRVIDLSHIF